MFEGPNITRSHGLPPPLNSSSVLATKASAGITSVSSLTPSLSYKSCSIRVSEYFTNSAFTTARIVCPSYGRAAGARSGHVSQPIVTKPPSSTATEVADQNRLMGISLVFVSSALRPAERQALDQIALEHEGDRERGQDAEHDRGRRLAIEHVGAARRERGHQDHHGLGLDTGEHDREQKLVPGGDEREQRDDGHARRDDRHDHLNQRSQARAAVDHRRFLDLHGKIAEKAHEEPHRERDVEHGVDDDQRQV